jgi:hypothetical protein
LTQKELIFIEERKKLLRSWRFVGPFLLGTIIALALFVYITTPLLIDPFGTASRLNAGEIPFSTLRMSTLLLPILFWSVLVLLIAIVGALHFAFANEKKYLAILEQNIKS